MTPQSLQKRIPSSVLVTGALVLLVPGIGCGVFAWAQWATLEVEMPQVASAIRFVTFAAPLGIVISAGIVGLMIAYRRWASHEYIKAHHVTELTKAQQQRFPCGLQSLSFHDSHKEIPGPEPLARAAAPITIPTFADLLGSGAIAAEKSFILGYGEQGPIEGDWKSLYSCGLGGVQGSGKTWTAAYLLGQSALHGAKILICDPHAGDDESLATRVASLSPAYLADVASDDRAILAALKLADDELQRRKAGSKDRWPLIVAVDEWTSLLRHELKDKLPAYVADFASEGRKFNVNCMLLGQGWTVDASGGADIRNRLTSHYVHRTRKEEARYQLGLGPLTPTDTITLAPGQAYLLTTRGLLTKVQIPLMAAADLVTIGRQIGGAHKLTNTGLLGSYLNTPTLEEPAIRLPFGFRPPLTGKQPESIGKAPAESGNTPPASGTVTPEIARIRALFKSGKSIGEIVKELYGDITGRPYQKARADIEAALRDMI